ncbi:Asp-tRNA(Asn)/Glu-tRNA(Gln) amidotransferase subunit GatC [Candidatus Micrarchaeota archaeon]|nr:Asp-tRNA(Asn)/Glu-tRNA(Gln) amidotransferase subunit GatC [Candidatus Micrarchaeota archaeon]
MEVRKVLEKIAAAQRVPLDEREKETFSHQISQVLAAFDRLDQVDTKGVPPSYHPVDIPAQLRPDEIEPSPAPVANARRTEKGYIKGPRMMKTA